MCVYTYISIIRPRARIIAARRTSLQRARDNRCARALAISVIDSRTFGSRYSTYICVWEGYACIIVAGNGLIGHDFSRFRGVGSEMYFNGDILVGYRSVLYVWNV